HEVFEVVDAPAGDEVVLSGKRKPLHEVIEQAGVDVAVEDEAGGAAALPRFQAFLQLFDEVGVDIVVQLELRIARYLDDVAEKAVEAEGREDVRQRQPDDVFEQDDVVLPVVRGKDHEAGQHFGGHQ